MRNNTSGSIAGRPRLALYSGAHSLRMNEKSMLRSIFRSRWSWGDQLFQNNQFHYLLLFVQFVQHAALSRFFLLCSLLFSVSPPIHLYYRFDMLIRFSL